MVSIPVVFFIVKADREALLRPGPKKPHCGHTSLLLRTERFAGKFRELKNAAGLQFRNGRLARPRRPRRAARFEARRETAVCAQKLRASRCAVVAPCEYGASGDLT